MFDDKKMSESAKRRMNMISKQIKPNQQFIKNSTSNKNFYRSNQPQNNVKTVGKYIGNSFNFIKKNY
jgi:hypothetical protein